jgi:hypothetical protein
LNPQSHVRFALAVEESKFHLARNFPRRSGLNFSVMKRQLLAAILLASLVSGKSFGQIPQRDFKRIQFSRLSLEEQARLRSAHDMAMRDPALLQSRARYEQARKEFRDRLRDALLKADPSVQPILEKARRQRHRDR